MSRMDNAELFRAIGSKTRVKMLKLLLRKNYHITGLAREIGISVPVAANSETCAYFGGCWSRFC